MSTAPSLAGDVTTPEELNERTDRRQRIDDPTIKVKAPDALLAVLGRSYTTALLNTARLREVCALLGIDAGPVVGSQHPATVVMFARATAEWLEHHEMLLRLILDGLGHVAFGDNGEVVCVGPCDRHQRSYELIDEGVGTVNESPDLPQMLGPDGPVLQPVE